MIVSSYKQSEIAFRVEVVLISHSALILNLVKAEDIPEAIGSAQACVTFSNPFARQFEISPSVGRPPNDSAPAIGKYEIIVIKFQVPLPGFSYSYTWS